VQWVYDYPIWVTCVVIIGGCCTLAGLGVAAIRRYDKRYAEITHNDVAGPIMTTIGTVLAVMLSFMVVVVWQEYDAAAGVVNTEANEVADLYHTVGAMPEPLSRQVRSDLIRYVQVVVADEWPQMRRGASSDDARRLAVAISENVEAFNPVTMGEQTLAADAIDHAHRLLDARRERLFQNQQAVPPLVWVMLFFVSIATLGSTAFFRVESGRAHLIMTVALAAVIGATFVLIAELDLPFRGPMQIGSSAFAMDALVFGEEPNR
jgi:hypothetical protein